MKRLGNLALFMVTGAMTYFALAWLLGFIPKIDAHLLAKIIMVHLVLHELGHWLVMEYYGVQSYIIFLVILGGAGPTKAYRKRYKELSWHQLAAVSLAGPLANAVICITAVVFFVSGNLDAYTTLLTINVGGSLLVYNLLPVWIFDGGHFVGYLFNSVSEDRDKKYQYGMTALIIATILVVSTVFLQTYFFALWMVVYGLHHAANHDDPRGSTNKKAMTRPQQFAWCMYYIVLVAVGFVALAATAKYVLPPK